MRVNWPGGPLPNTPRPNGAAGKAGTTFTLEPPDARPAAARASGGIGPAAGLAALLAIQAIDGPLERRRRAVRRGHGLLDRLEELRLGLLAGSVPVASLQGLRSELAGVEAPNDPGDDPGLRRVLEAIELRAAVEVAKLEA